MVEKGLDHCVSLLVDRMMETRNACSNGLTAAQSSNLQLQQLKQQKELSDAASLAVAAASIAVAAALLAAAAASIAAAAASIVVAAASPPAAPALAATLSAVAAALTVLV